MRPHFMQIAWLLLVLGGVVLVSLGSREATAGSHVVSQKRGREKPGALPVVQLEDGVRGIQDAGGVAVPIRDYQRIASGSTVADDLLLHMAEPERVLFLTKYGREHSAEDFRYGARPSLAGPSDLESLRHSQVDLLLLNHFGAPAELARAREAGVTVFNLGEMRGLDTLVPNIRVVAALLGHPERGERLIEKLRRRMAAVAADVPARTRKRAMYVSAYGGQLYGAGSRTSQHDVLTAAGLIDAAAERYSDFPHYDPEQLIDLDPDVIVTSEASVAAFCTINGLDHLRACSKGRGRIVGMSDALLSAPGLDMLEAAETLRDLVYGAPKTL